MTKYWVDLSILVQDTALSPKELFDRISYNDHEIEEILDCRIRTIRVRVLGVDNGMD